MATEKLILVHQARPPPSLKSFCLHILSQVLFRLYDSEMENTEIPWRTPESNPFFGVPHNLIEEIFESFKIQFFLTASHTVRKEWLQILLCKRLKKISLKYLLLNQEDVLPLLQVIEATHSDLWFLDVQILEKNFKTLYWSTIPPALKYLKNYIKTLPSLTHLNVSGACDDEMLEVIGSHCPNLIILVAMSNRITSEGLMKLSNDPTDQSRRCQNIQMITLDHFPSSKDNHLMEGIEWLLMNLPQLRVLKWSRELLGKIILKILDESNELPSLHLEELYYDASVQFTQLPSVVPKMFPNLISLAILKASNCDLLKFEQLSNLSTVSIDNCQGSVNFNEGITPFLQKMGKPLENLIIYFVDDINLSVINENCPSLKSLKCSCARMAYGICKNVELFRNLENLDLYCNLENGLRPFDCIRVLSQCHNLRCLNLMCCKDLREHHLRTILLHNPLIHLESASILSSTLYINENRPHFHYSKL